MATKMHLKICPNCKLFLRHYDNKKYNIERLICPSCNIILSYDNTYIEHYALGDLAKP